LKNLQNDQPPTKAPDIAKPGEIAVRPPNLTPTEQKTFIPTEKEK